MSRTVDRASQELPMRLYLVEADLDYNDVRLEAFNKTMMTFNDRISKITNLLIGILMTTISMLLALLANLVFN